jgi:ferric-dicitrate binding protein FerR (iron transport regulator)
VNSNVAEPFIVETSSMQVIATGTKFNVQEYKLLKTNEVTLISGKVIVNDLIATDSHLISELSPNQHLIYNRLNKEKSIIIEDPYRFIAWKDGKLIFRNEPLIKVLERLGVMFDVKIKLQGKELEDYRYHATFESESFEEILKLLKLSAPINFAEIKRDPYPDGSFPKKEVIIYPSAQNADKKHI